MQQMSMFSNFGGAGFGGGNQGGNNNNLAFQSLLGNTNTNQNQAVTPSFLNGQPAVLFTINMILEEKMDSLDMIWGAESKRDYYHVIALIYPWQENLEVLSDELINKYIYMI